MGARLLGLPCLCLLACLLLRSPGHAVELIDPGPGAAAADPHADGVIGRVEMIDPGEVVYVESRVDGVIGRVVTLECGATLPDVYIWGFTRPGTERSKAVAYDFGRGPRVQALARTLGDLTVISGSAALSIAGLPLSAQGLYTCQALYDTEQGAKFYYYFILLSVLVPVTKPHVEVSDVSPAEGSSAWLRCALQNGTQPIHYVWEHENHDGVFRTVAKGNSSMVNMTDINRNHTGWYRCSAQNKVNKQRSDRVRLDIIYGPDTPQIDVTPFTVTERGYSALERETVSLQCQARSNPPSQYVWLYNNTQVYSGPQYTITKILRMHTGTYGCLAHNTYLNTRARKTITLTVYYPPDGSPSCAIHPALNYTSLSLQCAWPGGLPAPSLRWTPGAWAPGREGAGLGEGRGPTNNATVVLQPGAQAFNNSLFTCRGSHPALDHSTHCTARTWSPPGSPECFAYATRNNQYLMLSCSWEGGAPLALLWWEGPGGLEHRAGKQTANILVLRSDSTRNGQAYTCYARHPLHPQDRACRLTLEAPVLVTQRSVVSVYEGSDVQLTCILRANYPPAGPLTWFNNRRQEVGATPRKYALQRAAAWTNLTVRETDGGRDSGQYWCSAVNAVGGAEIPVTLLVKRYPMPPNVTLVSLVYSSRQRSEVELAWQTEGEGPAGEEGAWLPEGEGPGDEEARHEGLTGFILERRRLEDREVPGRRDGGEGEEEEGEGEGGERSSAPTWQTVAVRGPGERGHTLPGLTPTVAYQFRVTAVNHRTVGHPSTAKTPADPPFNAYPAVIGAAIGGMILAAIATVLLFMYIIRNRNNNPRLHDMLFGMQHSQSRENIHFPEDEVVGGAEGEGGVSEPGSSPSPGPAMVSPRAASPRAASPSTTAPPPGQAPPPGDGDEPVNVTITVMATGS